MLSDEGHLLTNAHVVGERRRRRGGVRRRHARPFNVVGRDPLSDLAVVRADREVPGPPEYGDADALLVGSLVVAVGNPLGLAGRSRPAWSAPSAGRMPARTRTATRLIEDVIQTDAALNPGNSGGALADARGRVVGINTAVAGIGLGLAVPINATTHRIIHALINDGRVRRAYLGLVTTPARCPRRWPRGRPAHGAAGRRGGREQPGRHQRPAPRRPHPRDRRGAAGRCAIVQRRLFVEAIGTRVEVTVLRNGALVDAVTEPTELTD